MLIYFTDTDCDITPEVAAKYGYHLISMPYTCDGKSVMPYVDFDKFDSHPFYEKLRAGTMPKTSGLSPEDYKNYFEPCFKAGNDVMYVHFSREMSGTFNAMDIAVRELKEQYPERKFYAIDTKGITILSYNIACEIGDMILKGATPEEIMKWADEEIQKFAIYFYADNLTFFARSGRVTGISAVMGNIIGIHPIIHMNSEGKMLSVAKAHGRRGSLNKILDYVSSLQDDIKGHRVVIGHTDAPQIAELLGNMLKARFGDDLDITYFDVNPTAGSHCGPDGVGVCFHSLHR